MLVPLNPIYLKQLRKTKQAPQGNSHPPGLTHLDGIFWTQLICYEYFTSRYIP